jgi:hypothetical protein
VDLPLPAQAPSELKASIQEVRAALASMLANLAADSKRNGFAQACVKRQISTNDPATELRFGEHPRANTQNRTDRATEHSSLQAEIKSQVALVGTRQGQSTIGA